MATTQEWIPISGTEGLYSISINGKFRGNKRNKTLSPILVQGQYAYINLSVNGVRRRCYLHVLMADHFIPNPENLPEVNHMDGDKHNFYLENLERCTHRENIIHYYKYLRKEKSRSTPDELLFKICNYVIPIGSKGSLREHRMRYNLRHMIKKYSKLV